MSSKPIPRTAVTALVALAAATTACSDAVEPNTPAEARSAVAAASAPPPGPASTIVLPGRTLELWPFTTSDLANPSDPVNLVFIGRSDPREVRAALLALDGNRQAFLPAPLQPYVPVLPVLGCTWNDAMGGMQAVHTNDGAWSGSAIQLECGEYNGLRFHLRLFRVGDVTLANAHFETVIFGTHDHQVLSWELAEQFVTLDLIRSGLLAPGGVSVTGVIGPTPFFRDILPQIYLHPALQPLHPLIDAVVVGSTFGIRTDGRATVLELAGAVEPVPGRFTQELDLAFNQVIPKPFCNPGGELVRVTGPLRLRQTVVVTPGGDLTSQFMADGELEVTRFDPAIGQPVGPTHDARVGNVYRGHINDRIDSADGQARQMLMMSGAPNQHVHTALQVGPHGRGRFTARQQCGS